MWVFTKEGFFSAVSKNCKPDELVVRSRLKRDLVALCRKLDKRLPIITNGGTDYAFRVIIKRADWGRYLAHSAMDLDYSNFKAMIPNREKARHDAYMDCWSALYRLQVKIERVNTQCFPRHTRTFRNYFDESPIDDYTDYQESLRQLDAFNERRTEEPPQTKRRPKNSQRWQAPMGGY